FPLRSARPRLSNRPVRVTIPAPRITPTIPSKGLCERSIGSAAIPEDCAAGGRFAGSAMDEALMARLLSTLFAGSYCHYRGKPRTQLGGERRVIKGNFDWHSL